MHPGASLPWPVRMLRHSRAGRASGAGGGVDHAGRTGAAGHQGRTDVPAVGVRQAEVVQTACGVWKACVLFVLHCLLLVLAVCPVGASQAVKAGLYTRHHPRARPSASQRTRASPVSGGNN